MAHVRHTGYLRPRSAVLFMAVAVLKGSSRFREAKNRDPTRRLSSLVSSLKSGDADS